MYETIKKISTPISPPPPLWVKILENPSFSARLHYKTKVLSKLHVFISSGFVAYELSVRQSATEQFYKCKLYDTII